MDCSPSGSSVYGILQARILKWVVVPSSKESSWSRNGTHISGISCIASRSFTHWATCEAFIIKYLYTINLMYINWITISCKLFVYQFTKAASRGDLNNTNLFFHSSGGWKSKIKMSGFSWGISVAFRWPPSYCVSLHARPWCLFVSKCPLSVRASVRLNSSPLIWSHLTVITSFQVLFQI